MNTPNKWAVSGTRVYGKGTSYNCLNKVTAQELCNTLNTYETTSVQYKDIEDKLDRIQKTVISLQMSCSIMSDELKKLHEVIL